ncbi:hypothetical protein CEXT_35451 [Caerostris extrusa]|uniref:Uncharacterized protein n=1 Tax=Caerostris extrusa TaxID=172846 RepID=A0AAV4UHM8_CAEEX|nr:hypothetical protein CEXT_35451 [Caerostris extrusa]
MVLLILWGEKGCFQLHVSLIGLARACPKTHWSRTCQLSFCAGSAILCVYLLPPGFIIYSGPTVMAVMGEDRTNPLITPAEFRIAACVLQNGAAPFFPLLAQLPSGLAPLFCRPLPSPWTFLARAVNRPLVNACMFSKGLASNGGREEFQPEPFSVDAFQNVLMRLFFGEMPIAFTRSKSNFWPELLAF